MTASMTAIGVDIGGSGVRAGVVTPTGAIRARPLAHDDDLERAWGAICDCIVACAADRGVIGVAFPPALRAAR